MLNCFLRGISFSFSREEYILFPVTRQVPRKTSTLLDIPSGRKIYFKLVKELIKLDGSGTSCIIHIPTDRVSHGTALGL